MPQMALTVSAAHLGSFHAMGRVLAVSDRGVLGSEKCGPPAVRIKLGIRAKQLCSAGAATVNTLSLFMQVFYTTGAFGARFAQNLVFVGIESGSPIGFTGGARVKISHHLTFLQIIFAHQFASQAMNFLVRAITAEVADFLRLNPAGNQRPRHFFHQPLDQLFSQVAAEYP